MSTSILSKIEVPEGKHVLRILDNSGHRDVVYDPLSDVEVAEAIAAFEEQLIKKPRVYALDGEGGGAAIKRFDKTEPQIVVAPQTVGG